MEPGAVVTPPYVAGPLDLRPFRAHLLQPSRAGDPASARLFGRPHRGIPARLRQWEARGRITTDGEPAVYLHEYTADGTTVRGLVGTVDIARRARDLAGAVVLPHEGIHPAQADELANRMEEMELNPAPILLVHVGTQRLRDHLDGVAAEPPVRQFADAARQRHRLWVIRRPDDLALISSELAQTRALIADGHHRYAAYLRVQARHPGTPADRGLMMLVDQLDTPLRLHAIHRVLGGVRMADVQAAAAAVGLTFEFRPGPSGHDVDPATIAITDGRQWALIRLPAHLGTVVELVHDVLLPALPRGPRGVAFHPDPRSAVAEAGRRRSIALLLPAPRLEEVLHSVAAGRLLPEKATSFRPKPTVGVLMRSLRDEDAAR